MLKVKITSVVVLVIIVALGIAQIMWPLPKVTAVLSGAHNSTIPGNLALSLPSQGQSAVGISDIGLISASPNESSVPIASVTKLMTAYVVLHHHPLSAFANGPTYTMTSSDVSQYVKDKSSGDSVVKVVAGENWTEREMLEGLLLPSGDNMANTLARWTSGSEAAFVADMNQTAKKLGMTHTKYADSSGVNPGSASTATDQLKLAEVDMKIPAFRQIVRLAQANLPGAGIVYNVNYMVGHNGVVGIKTGSTPQAGGCFVSAVEDKISGKTIILIGSVLGQQGVQPLATAVSTSVKLAKQVAGSVKLVTLPKGSTVGYMNVPWQGRIPLKTTKQIAYLTVPGLTIHNSVVVSKSGTQYKFNLEAGQQSFTVPLSQSEKLRRAPLSWKLLRGIHTIRKLKLF